MNVQLVKSAEGCRVRDPKTGNVLPSVADTDAAGVPVDLDDPYWFRTKACGDIVLATATATVAAAPATQTAAPASTPAASSSAAKSA